MAGGSEGHAFTRAGKSNAEGVSALPKAGFWWMWGAELLARWDKAKAEKRAFGRAGAPLARPVCGTRERVPFRG